MAQIEKSEKLTISIGLIDLGQIDLLVNESFYANRTDSIRTAIRRQLESRSDAVDQTVARRTITLGTQHYSRRDLEELRAAGRTVELRPGTGDYRRRCPARARAGDDHVSGSPRPFGHRPQSRPLWHREPCEGRWVEQLLCRQDKEKSDQTTTECHHGGGTTTHPRRAAHGGDCSPQAKPWRHRPTNGRRTGARQVADAASVELPLGQPIGLPGSSPWSGLAWPGQVAPLPQRRQQRRARRRDPAPDPRRRGRVADVPPLHSYWICRRAGAAHHHAARWHPGRHGLCGRHSNE